MQICKEIKKYKKHKNYKKMNLKFGQFYFNYYLLRRYWRVQFFTGFKMYSNVLFVRNPDCKQMVFRLNVFSSVSSNVLLLRKSYRASKCPPLGRTSSFQNICPPCPPLGKFVLLLGHLSSFGILFGQRAGGAAWNGGES